MSDDSTQQPSDGSKYIGAGIVFGSSLGVVYGIVFDQLAMGMCVGVSLGICAGVNLANRAGEVE